MKTLFAHNEKFPILWSLLLAAGLALSACSDDETAGGSSEDENTVAIENMTIMGVSQKGPFVRGSTVTANELQDGKTLKQTGKTFAGTIRSNDGLFDIKSVKLASQYAYMVVNGFYQNEVTGEKSSAPISLQALTDLTLRSEANINLLTHLEYERVVSLVTHDELSVRKAKAQAEGEILKAFYIDLSLEANFEDLNIFSAGDANAALLAISIMMQGDLDEANFSERLADFAQDMEGDGDWNNEATKAKIADWASATDLNGGLETIKTNIDGWNLGTAPDFEKYVRNFWYVNYGLGDCDKRREGEVAADSNTNSANYYKNSKIRFICKSGAWVEASDIEKDTYGWAAGEDGEIKPGDITQFYYVYDDALDRWQTLIGDAFFELRGCTTNRTDEIGRSGETYYVCKNSDWQIATEIDLDTYGEKCTSVNVGKTMNGKMIESNKYYCSSNGWVSLMSWSWYVPKGLRFNPDIDYDTMTDSRDGKTYRIVTIEDQVWMAENLNYDYNKGTAKSYCFDNIEAYCEVTGRLYTWSAAIDSVELANDADNPQICGYGTTCTFPATVQGICPDGWHLPSYEEWGKLFDNVGGISSAGTTLKTVSGWYPQIGGVADRDAYGFSVLPAGSFYNGDFWDAGVNADFWSSTEHDGSYSRSITFNNDLSIAIKANSEKNRGFSVRCLKN